MKTTHQSESAHGGSAGAHGSAKWVILFTSIGGTSDEWETAEGTLEQAIAQATCDRRHLNYGRNGFRIVPDISPNAALCEAADKKR